MKRLPVVLSITLLVALTYVAPIHAAGVASCAEQSQCPVPAQPGLTSPTSRVILRAEQTTPPSVEYRRPDEVVTLDESSVESAPLTRDVPVTENRAEPVPTVLPQFSSGLDELGQRERKALAPLVTRLQGKLHLHLRVTGHADQQRMTPETKRRFGDNVGLSKARAQVVVDFLKT